LGVWYNLGMREIDEKKIKELAQEHKLELLLIFGSQVSGKTHPMSDFDFGFIGEIELSYEDKGKLAHELSMLLGFSDVEVVDLKKANPFLLKEIVKNNRIVFEKKGAYADFFSSAVRKYFQAGPIFKLQEILYSKTIDNYRKKYAK